VSLILEHKLLTTHLLLGPARRLLLLLRVAVGSRSGARSGAQSGTGSCSLREGDYKPTVPAHTSPKSSPFVLQGVAVSELRPRVLTSSATEAAPLFSVGRASQQIRSMESKDDPRFFSALQRPMQAPFVRPLTTFSTPVQSTPRVVS